MEQPERGSEGTRERGTPSNQAAGLAGVHPRSFAPSLPRSGGEAAPAIGLPAIAITGGKGGVGKTCIAVNLAVLLAKLGLRTLLVDLDLGLANADVLLGVNPDHTLADVVLGGQSIASIITPTPFGFGFLPAASGIDELSTATQAQLHTLFAGLMVLAKNYDLLIVDTPAGIGREVMTALRSSRMVAVVVTPDPTSLTDAYALIKVLEAQSPGKDIRVIINEAGSRDEAQQVFNRLAGVARKHLGRELTLLGDCPRDAVVADGVRRRRPFTATDASSPAIAGLTAVAKRLKLERWR